MGENMTDEKSLKEFEEMFDLSPASKDEENTQAEEYGHSLDSKESFDNLVKDVNEKIKEVPDKGSELEVEKVVEDPHDIIRDIASRPEPEPAVEKEHEEELKAELANSQRESKIEQKIVSTIIGEMDFDTLPEQEVSKEEVLQEVAETHEKMKEDVVVDEGVYGVINHVSPKDLSKIDESIEDHRLDDFSVDADSMIDGDKTKWSLKSSSTMYEPFYRQKKRMLDSCLVGGQIEYSRWTKELEEAQVDVITDVFDQQVIINQMEQVQKHRNRVKYIGVRVNNQYFLFKRFAPLLRGYLARIQYLKPVLKQDGLVLEHMGDIEMYFERLEGLHKSVSDTENNLAAAYEMLSRKVTICMELPPAERRSRPEEKTYKLPVPEYEAPEEMKDFDELPSDATAGPKEKKSGAVGWNAL